MAAADGSASIYGHSHDGKLTGQKGVIERPETATFTPIFHQVGGTRFNFIDGISHQKVLHLPETKTGSPSRAMGRCRFGRPPVSMDLGPGRIFRFRLRAFAELGNIESGTLRHDRHLMFYAFAGDVYPQCAWVGGPETVKGVSS